MMMKLTQSLPKKVYLKVNPIQWRKLIDLMANRNKIDIGERMVFQIKISITIILIEEINHMPMTGVDQWRVEPHHTKIEAMEGR